MTAEQNYAMFSQENQHGRVEMSAAAQPENPRFTNTGLWSAEALFVSAHERAQRLSRPSARPGDGRFPGSPVTMKTRRPSLVSGFDLIANGIGLKDFLRFAGYSAPMRGLRAAVLQPSHAGLYRMLARVPATVLGRSIPDAAKAQHVWLRALDGWLPGANGRETVIAIQNRCSRNCVERFATGRLSRPSKPKTYWISNATTRASIQRGAC